MSDQRLRELERKWRESGSVEDEAAYLRERVRVGDLTQERLELAAYCGHEGARASLPDSPRSESYHELLRHLWGQGPTGRHALLRACRDVAASVAPAWEATEPAAGQLSNLLSSLDGAIGRPDLARDLAAQAQQAQQARTGTGPAALSALFSVVSACRTVASAKNRGACLKVATQTLDWAADALAGGRGATTETRRLVHGTALLAVRDWALKQPATLS